MSLRAVYNLRDALNIRALVLFPLSPSCLVSRLSLALCVVLSLLIQF